MSLSTLRSLIAAGLLSLLCMAPALAQNTMVRLHTTQGPIDVKLLDAQAPITVANFLAYVRGGDYTDVMFHRSVRNFIIQGGGFRWPAAAGSPSGVTSRGTIQNEFSPTRSNLRGTVAMAKVDRDANSATSEWFVNLGDNSANLDRQNSGFTVFARVTTPGMAVVDKIAALPIVKARSPYSDLPLFNWVNTNPILRDNVVLVTQATEFLPQVQQTESDRILNYLEAAYPQYLAPSLGVAGTFEGYSYRWYSGSNAFLASNDGKVWYLSATPGSSLIDLGAMADWLAVAQAAGY